MSPRRRTRRRLVALATVALASLAAPLPAAAHALGQVFTLPVPLTLYLLAAGAAVAASFVVAVLVVRPTGPIPTYRRWPIGGGTAMVGSWVLRLIGLTWWLATILTRALHDRGLQPEPIGSTVGAYAATLLPIAGGYLIAHYLTLLVQGFVWLPALLADPNASVAPPLDWIPISGVWYLSVGAIVVGHVAAVVLALRQALRDAPSRSMSAGLPLVILMIGYTVVSLWIIAQPITLEPSAASSFLAR